MAKRSWFLGGGFKDFLFSARSLGKWSNLTGWNHQLGLWKRNIFVVRFSAEVACLFFMSGMLLLNSILMMIKFLRRHVLSDVFFTFFFVFGSLGYGLHAIASQTLAAGDNWSVAWSVGRIYSEPRILGSFPPCYIGNSWRTWHILGHRLIPEQILWVYNL